MKSPRNHHTCTSISALQTTYGCHPSLTDCIKYFGFICLNCILALFTLMQTHGHVLLQLDQTTLIWRTRKNENHYSLIIIQSVSRLSAYLGPHCYYFASIKPESIRSHLRATRPLSWICALVIPFLLDSFCCHIASVICSLWYIFQFLQDCNTMSMEADSWRKRVLVHESLIE